MAKKNAILWIAFSFLHITLGMDLPAASMAGAAVEEDIASLFGTLAVGPAGAAAATDPSIPAPIQEALEIIGKLIAIKAIDPYLLTEVPAGVPMPDPGALVSILPDCHLFYSETEQHRMQMFLRYIQQPLFRTLQLVASTSFAFPQTFIHESPIHPLVHFMAFETFGSADALEKLKLLFLKIAEIKAEEYRLNELQKTLPQKKGKLRSPVLDSLEKQRDDMLDDQTLPMNRFAHYL